MPLDRSSFISEINPTNPVGSIDTMNTVDDHIREGKRVLKNSFPLIDKQVQLSADDMNTIKDKLVRTGDSWDVKDSNILNVKEIDDDNAVQPRSYNDSRYLQISKNLEEITDQSAALKNLLVGIDQTDDNIKALSRMFIDIMYPVGTIITTIKEGYPNDWLKVGTWQRYGMGRVLIGAGQGTDENNVKKTFTKDSTGGEYEHTLIIDEMPEHDHDERVFENDGQKWGTKGDNWGPSTKKTSKTGGGKAHNNIQPYIAVYYWVRTA